MARQITRASQLHAAAVYDDAALLVRMASGDAAALAELYDRYAALLLSAAVRTLGNRREAEDLLHDVLLEVWRCAADYDATRGSVRAWLLLRVRSRALDALRRNAVLPTHSLDTGAVWGASGASRSSRASTPPPPLAASERLVVRDALQRLPPALRDVLELTYFDGMLAREIAARLRVPLGTVKSRLARGLRELSSLLAREEGTQHVR